MKKIFKNLLLASTTFGLTLPIVGCACSNQEEKQEDKKTIEIVSKIDDLTIMEDETHLSKPIEAKCYDSKHQEKKIDIQFDLKIQGNDTLPNWIYITDNNEIKLTGGKVAGTYKFNLQAFNTKEKIYSSTKTFTVNVIEERHIIPDKIDIEVEDNKYCMYGEETILPIKIIPSKGEIEEKYLLKSCDVKVYVTQGLSQDLNGLDLFKISDSTIDPDLIVSKDTNKEYDMTYKLVITATLLDDPTIQTSKEITLDITNVRFYQDETTKYTYTRENADQDWTLALANPEKQDIKGVLTKIQNKPVTKIAEDICNKTGIEQIINVILPDTIITIGDSAFEGQKAFTYIAMPGVKNVGKNAFYGDDLLQYRPKYDEPSLVNVGENAFCGCKKLKWTAEQDFNEISNFAFKNAGFSEFTIGLNCTYIGDEAFAECSNLSSFKIQCPKPPLLGGGVFSKCYNLKTIFVPAEYLDLYKQDEHWSILEQKIEGI